MKVAIVHWKWHDSDMNRQHIFKGNLNGHADDNFVPGTVESRLGLVWPLTREVASLSPSHDPERRLQRHITCLKRRAG